MKTQLVKSVDPYYNLAAEEHIFKNCRDDNYLLLWQNDNTVVVGRHQNTAEEVNGEFIKSNSVNVVRRITGGGAVYHDLGNLNFSFISNVENIAEMTMSFFLRPIMDALASFGVVAELSGRNDITVEGRKISGNAQAIHANRILHHGTLLFNSDLSVLGRALSVRPEKFQSKGFKSVGSRVANIREFIKRDMDMGEFKEAILSSLSKNNATESFEFSESDSANILKLCEGKYRTWDWNYGKSPDFNVKNALKFDGGFLEAYLFVKNGIISQCRFYGDFMAVRPADEVSEALIGCKYDAFSVKKIIDGLPAGQYFGSITPGEILAACCL